MHRSKLATLAAAAAALLTLVGCAGTNVGPDDRAASITLRLWDEQVAEAYDVSIHAFMAANPDIDVEVKVVPWNEYWTSLRAEVAAGMGDDVFWLNASYYEDYVDNNLVTPVSQVLGDDAAAAWNPQVIEQFTKNGELWGVPQVTDGGSALYYNAEALAKAGVTPAELENLTWHPTDPAADTLLPLLQRVTLDAAGRNAADPEFDASTVQQWGFNAAQELQNIELNFIGSNGGTYQDAQGHLTLSHPQTVEAYSYIVSLINDARVAPPATLTNANGDYTRDAFLDGTLALFQSGTYNLAHVHEGADFEWGVLEMPAGPAGHVTTAPGVVAAANAATEHPEAVAELLAWLGSAEGNEPVAAAGAAVPAVTDARGAYDGFWAGVGVDVSPFFTVLEGNEQIPPAMGQNFGAMVDASKPYLDDVFLGSLDVETGLVAAEEAANAVA